MNTEARGQTHILPSNEPWGQPKETEAQKVRNMFTRLLVETGWDELTQRSITSDFPKIPNHPDMFSYTRDVRSSRLDIRFEEQHFMFLFEDDDNMHINYTDKRKGKFTKSLIIRNGESDYYFEGSDNNNPVMLHGKEAIEQGGMLWAEIKIALPLPE